MSAASFLGRPNTVNASNVKLVPAKIMKRITVVSIAPPWVPDKLSKCPRLALYVLKPPVAIVVKAWQIASNTLIPRISRTVAKITFNPMYIAANNQAEC